jgi:CheY-like chemotaxis protein
MATKSILLIEHEADLREVLQTILQEFGGWQVTISNSIRKEFACASKSVLGSYTESYLHTTIL